MAQLIQTADSGGSSGLIVTNDATWATARNAASADSENTSQCDVASRFAGGSSYGITRGTNPIDLSTLPTGISVTSSILSITYSDLGGGILNPESCDIDVVLLSSMADETNAGVGDYNKFGTTVGGSIAFASVSEGANIITLNATAFGWIESAAGDWLRLGLRNSRDTDNASPTGINAIDTIGITGTQITINYTIPSGLLLGGIL